MTRLYNWFDHALKGRKILLFLVTAAVALAYLIFFQSILEEFERVKLNEKIYDIDRAVNIIADGIKYDAVHMPHEVWEQNREYLDAKIALGVSEIDKGYAILARLYKGKELEKISTATHTFDEPFDPLAYPDFVAEVMSKFNVAGSYAYTVTWYGAGDGGHDLHMRYRWVPVIDHVDDPYLIVFGVSKYSIQTSIQAWLTVGIIIFGVYIVVVTLALIGYILYIIDRRKEPGSAYTDL